MRLSTAEKSLYKQYEESLNKINKQDRLIKNLKENVKQNEKMIKSFDKLVSSSEKNNRLIKELNNTIKTLSENLKDKDELVAKLLLEIDRLKNQINKDSSNSSKPGSSDTKPPKSGANLYNGRKKSGKKPGGQKGHKGSNLSKSKIEDLIARNAILVKEIKHTIKGNNKKENIIKYKLGVEVVPYVEKHIFTHDEKSNLSLPQDFYTDVTYDVSIKSLCIQLGAYNVVAIERLSDFLDVNTNGVIKVSNGSICNFYKEFSNLSQPIINNLEDEILNSSLMYTDLTEGKINNKKAYFRNYSKQDTALFKVNFRKGHNPIKEENILNRYMGTIMGDHDTALYSYGNFNVECIVHVARYLEELIQNIPKLTWAKELKEMFYEVNNKIKKFKNEGINHFDKEVILSYNTKYDELLIKAFDENNEIKSSFYKGKAKTLRNRLIKYRENHLEFINDFNIPFSNNLSEQDLRIIKIKTKISSFRSYNGAKQYADILTIIKTAIKRDVNPYTAIKNVYLKKPCFQ